MITGRSSRDTRNYLPTFNSISIANMIWRIKGLSENFVYFNDDTFLMREYKPEDWFPDGRPLLTTADGCLHRCREHCGTAVRIFFNRHILGRK
ncbi:MAG: hypothetical protein MZV63_48255 [Marinilabiliales bacterium]|nr:hypothetical protein [Marinilabiliales bacterium]